jgi:hypothetical protein
MKMSQLQQHQSELTKITKGHCRKSNALNTVFLTILVLCCPVSIAFGPKLLLAEQYPGRKSYSDQILIERVHSGQGGGQTYRLTYTVPVHIDVYWRFKTDFDNDFLEENKFILSHRLIGRENNSVITENKYTSKPNVVFRWKTTFSHENFRLDFVLLNPESTGHDFHYGHILLTPRGDATQVVQEVHFNFFGASFWAIYPWSGGMTEFLTYTAKWEQDMVLKLYHQYSH